MASMPPEAVEAAAAGDLATKNLSVQSRLAFPFSHHPSERLRDLLIEWTVADVADPTLVRGPNLPHEGIRRSVPVGM